MFHLKLILNLSNRVFRKQFSRETEIITTKLIFLILAYGTFISNRFVNMSKKEILVKNEDSKVVSFIPDNNKKAVKSY